MIYSMRSISLVLAAICAFSSVSNAQALGNVENALSAKGDAAKGKRLFNSCLRCHVIDANGIERVGPNLLGIVGREVASVPGYRYSSALKSANFVWSEEKLNEWLMEPRTFLPGNRMTFTGLNKEQERLNLLAYIKQVTVPIEEELE